MLKTPDMKRSSAKRYSWYALAALMVLLCAFPSGAFAAGPPVPSEMSKPMAQVLIFVIIGLLLIIALLANVVMGAAQLFLQRYKDAKNAVHSGPGKVLSLLLVCLLSTPLFAQDAATAATATAAAAPAADNYGGLSATAFYALISVIFIELIILFTLLYNLRLLLAKEAAAISVSGEVVVKPAFSWSAWWDKFNSLRPIQEEANIDLGHDYDGIRELDNRLPPWWLYGFYVCIVVAGVYLYRYHVAHTAPLPKEELQIAMKAAEAEKEEYLKKSANKVDENTVTYQSDAATLEAGKKIFTTVCAACHLADGGGSVGPNLTDDYWIHGGSIKDIFKTIKYGWPEKGMKSWQDDYSPVQIAQLASFVKSLKGTKPAKAKEPQGPLYEENAGGAAAPAAADSAKAQQPAADKK